MGSIFVGICIFFSSSCVGLWVKKRYLKRLGFYQSYHDFLAYASDKIGYERMIFPEIVRTFRSESKEFSELLFGGRPSISISDDALSSVIEFIASIGTTDADTQLSSLRSKSAEISSLLEKEGAKWKKDATLYFKLSVLVGIALFIILV